MNDENKSELMSHKRATRAGDSHKRCGGVATRSQKKKASARAPQSAAMQPAAAASPPQRMRRTLSAPLLGRSAFADLPLAGAIAGPDTFMGFRREFVRRQRLRQQQERQRLEDAQRLEQRRSQLETVTGGLTEASRSTSRGSLDASTQELSLIHI